MASVPTGANDPYRPRTFRALVLGHALRPVTLQGIGAFRLTLLKVNLLRLASGSTGVRFRSGEPDFAPFALATVSVGGYRDDRYGSAGTMNAADKALAQRLGLSEAEVRQWINENQYVWHERQDGVRIDLVCHDIHGNIPHSGGIAANRARRR
jgi:hypothetical protein